MIKWILRICPWTDKEQELRVGAMVRTEKGVGVVTGGAIRIKYDRSVGVHENEKTWCHDLSKVELL